jgi:RHS repeat-associated protein
VVTNAAKQVVWRAANRAFERSVSIDQIGGYHLGFPGQYYDSESNLWHNGFRDYEPTIGRYIQSDLIGLVAGISTYGYVSGNPIRNFDAEALAEICYRALHAPGGRALWTLDNIGRVATFGWARRFDDKQNIVGAHQQIVYKNGSNSGFGPKGIFKEDAESEYTQCQGNYDDTVMRRAERNVQRTGKFKADDYKGIGNNCQNYVDSVVKEYLRLMINGGKK